MEVFRPYGFDKPLFYTTLFLITLGLVMVTSASGFFAQENYQQQFYFSLQQFIGAAVGLALIIFLLPIRKPYYKSPVFVFGLLGLTFGLLVLCFAMPTVANTNRWIVFHGMRFQPSELAKISLILFLAWYIDRKREKIREFRVLAIPLGVVLLFTFLILREPDFGSAVLILFLCFIVLYLGGVRIKYFLLLGLGLIPILTVYLFSAKYRIDRLTAFLSPEANAATLNFQVNQSKLAVGSGGLFGVSFGESIQKMFFLPCSHTDFIFAIIGEEFGLLGALVTLALFAALVWRGLSISMKAPDLFSQLTAAGLTLFLGIQALLNMTVVLGLGPAKGVPLPLVSFGRSSLVCDLLAIGLLLHISQRKGDGRGTA
jgi:cell division protein FtsW